MNGFRLLLGIAAASAALVVAAPASATNVVITFDAGDPIGGLAAGQVLSDQYAGWGAVFSPNAFSGLDGPNGAWATNTDMTIVSSTGVDVGALGTPTLASGNVLHSFGNYLNENGDPSFSVLFSAGGVTSFSASFAGVQDPSAVHLYAYSGNLLLGSVTGASAGQFTLSFSSATPITRVALTPGDYNDWVAVDNIAYSTIAAVPEPRSVALLGAGLLMLVLRRRRSVDTRAALAA